MKTGGNINLRVMKLVLVVKLVTTKSARMYYDGLFKHLEDHHELFRNSIPLVASENVSSPAVREAIVTDFGHRYAEGWPGERVYAGCKYIDKVELDCVDLAKGLFRAEFADVRPISGVCANLAIYSAFTDPNDMLMALAIPNGGHISTGRKAFHGTAGLVHGLRVEYFSFNKEEMNIDVDKTKDKFEKMMKDDHNTPKLAMFGGSLFLFPHPLKELSDFLHSYDVFVCYDSAHVSGLICGGQFQDPLREGADVMTLSTHKTLFGPQGGIILSFDKYSEQIKSATFPGTSSNHHLHNVAGKAVALAEMMEFGAAYAKQVIGNAKALAQSLYENGIDVLGEKNGFTESHQVAVNITAHGKGGDLERDLEQANIILNRQLIPGDIKAGRHYTNPGGLRIGTSEITRLGMKESDMQVIADLMKKVIVDKVSLNVVKEDVSQFRKNFQKIHYAFDKTRDAYDYVRIR